MEFYEIIISEGFQSNFLDKSVYQEKSLQVSFLYPSVSLTQASLEFSKVISKFSEANVIQIKINAYCVILSEGYQKIFEGLSQLKNLQKFSLVIRDRCLFDQDIFSYFICSSYKLQNLQELTINIFYKNFLNKSSLKQIDIIFKQNKNLLKLYFVNNSQSYFQNEVLISLYNGLSQLSNLKDLQIIIDFQYLDNSILMLLGKTLQGLEKLEILNIITNNQKRSKKLNDILRYLKHLPNLTNLEISNLILENQDVSEFIENLQHLRSLKKIKFKQIFIENKGTIDQIQKTVLNAMQLEVCDLSFYNIERWDDKFIKQFGSSLQLLQNLQELSLNQCILNRYHLSEFEENIIDVSLLGISLKHLHNLQKLNLNLQLNQEGLEKICEGIYSLQQLKQLKLIIKRQDKTFEKKFGVCVGNSLKNKNNLQQLILHYNYEICLDEAISISEGISYLINAEEIKIAFKQQLQYEFILMIYQSLNKLPSLKHINLSTNYCLRRLSVNQKYNEKHQIMNPSFSLQNLINLQSLEIWIIIQNEQGEELISLRDSFRSMKNLKYLNLDIQSNFKLKIKNLDYLANGLSSLVSLCKMNLQINFEYDLNVNDKFFENIFHDLKNLIKLEISITKQMTKHMLNDLINGLIYLKYLSQLHLKIFQKLSEYLEDFSNILINLQNLILLELYCSELGLLDKQEYIIQKFVQSLGNHKKLNQFIGPQNLIKQIQNEIIQNKMYLNNLVMITNQNFKNSIKYPNCIKEELYDQQDVDQIEQNPQYQLQNIQAIIDKIIIDDKLSQQQMRNVFIQIQQYKFLQNLDIQLETILIDQQDISLMIESLSSFKFLTSLNISSEQTNFCNYKKQSTILKLSASLINAISLSLKNFKYLDQLTLEISKQNEKIKLSDGISSLQNLKQLNLFLNNFSNEDWIDFNLVNTFIQLKQLVFLKFNIGDSQFCEKEAINLSIGIINIKRLSTLSIITGNNSQINELGAKSIGEAINHHSDLRKLNIIIGESNNIGDTGAESIMGLESYLNKLLFLTQYEIKIKQKNNITTQIFDRLQNIHEYCIGQIDIGLELNTVPSIQQLYQQYDNLLSLLKDRKSLKFNFEKNQLLTTKIIGYSKKYNCHFNINLGFEENSQEDCFFLLNPLKHHTNLKSLSLYICNINQEIAQSFEKNIQLFQSLEEIRFLNIDGYQKNDTYIQIANGLQKLIGLKKLEIKIRYLDYISEFIQKIEVLQQLNNLTLITRSLENQNKDQQLQIIQSLSKLNNLKCIILNTGIQGQFRSNLLRCLAKKIKRLVKLEVYLDYSQDYQFN